MGSLFQNFLSDLYIPFHFKTYSLDYVLIFEYCYLVALRLYHFELPIKIQLLFYKKQIKHFGNWEFIGKKKLDIAKVFWVLKNVLRHWSYQVKRWKVIIIFFHLKLFQKYWKILGLFIFFGEKTDFKIKPLGSLKLVIVAQNFS